jgi:serine/threonine protein kinase
MNDSTNTSGSGSHDAGVRESVKDVFARVLECREASDIEGASEELAKAGLEVRAQVERLLAAHKRAEGLLHEVGPVDAGLRISGYDVGAEIGRGGFGVVYEGRQRVPVDRPVALKVLKVERSTPQVLARFREEARVLGRLDHPNIARILDAGLDSGQRPYVALELVRGVPLLRYCVERGVGLRARVELMAQVCRAVHHAHQRAVIHRDLKPANILVEDTEHGPRARVIDFGIAKTHACGFAAGHAPLHESGATSRRRDGGCAERRVLAGRGDVRGLGGRVADGGGVDETERAVEARAGRHAARGFGGGSGRNRGAGNSAGAG